MFSSSHPALGFNYDDNDDDTLSQEKALQHRSLSSKTRKILLKQNTTLCVWMCVPINIKNSAITYKLPLWF